MDFHAVVAAIKSITKAKLIIIVKAENAGTVRAVTANTVFHGMKMPVLKAFHMIFKLTAKKKGMSTTELGSEVGVQQKTAWLFKRKVQLAMKQDNYDKL